MKYDEFSTISKPEFYNKEITIKCVVSGKTDIPYFIPNLINIKCASVKCLCEYKTGIQLELKSNNPDILLFIDAPNSKIPTLVKQTFKLKCDKFYCEVVKVQTIERIFIGQLPGEGKKADHTLRTAYFIGHGIDINTSYLMKGYTTADPFTQKATHVFTTSERVKSNIDTFNLSKIYSHLQEFEIVKPTAEKIISRLEELYDTYAKNITRVYHRFDLHLAIDLVFHSALAFRFGDDIIQRGWLDVLVIGDTSTAKTPVAHRLSEYYSVGEFVNAESCSYAGLVGGLQQFDSKQWAISWGRLPLNDGGLVIIDEAANLGDDWMELSRIRSEGIAEVTKIRSGVTSSRTRLLSLCNPIQKTISDYSYGIESILDIFKAPEDIKRFDYILVVAHNEVKMVDINKTVDSVDFLYPRFLEQQLILWVWSRKQNEIVFTEEAKKKIYDASIMFGNTYDPSIPLIQGENIRIKLARISVAFAARVFSNRNKGQLLLVDACHVECACSFLNIIYKKESSGYYQRSQLKKLEQIGDDWQDSIDKYLSSFGRNSIELCKYFLNSNTFTSRDVEEYLGVPTPIAKEIISRLIANSCLNKKHGFYTKTKNFTEYLKQKIFVR